MQLGAVMLLAVCTHFPPPHLAAMPTEEGRAGMVDFDYRDYGPAAELVGEYCGDAGWLAPDVQTQGMRVGEESRQRIMLRFVCRE